MQKIGLRWLPQFLRTAFFVFTLQSAATQTPLPFCASDFYHTDSIFGKKQAVLDLAVAQFFKNKKPENAGTASKGQLVTIPVVVHLLHDNGPENLSDNRVQAAINWLNDAFANAQAYDRGSGTNVPVRFCLATRAPDGSPTKGILRRQTPLSDLDLETEDAALKSLSRWDTKSYLNIWAVRSICSAAWGCDLRAYATQPVFHGGANDGIVIEAGVLGLETAENSTLAHEVGHYLGLYHTFEGGCANADCLSDGDHICDTPPDASTLTLPCDVSFNSCTGDDLPDPMSNFMDYGDFECLHDFTPDQSARMLFFLDNVRQSLKSSNGCGLPCPTPISVAVSANPGIVSVGEVVQFSSQSSGAAQFGWSLGGQVFSTGANADFAFSQEGVYTVSLTVLGADTSLCPSATATVAVQVICPVVADFQASALDVPIGEMVFFSNQSQNFNQTNWTVGGLGQGSDLSSFTFPEAGSFLVVLTASNGICARSKTLSIFVRDTACGEQTWQKTFGRPDLDEEGKALILLQDGQMLAGGDGAVAGRGREAIFVKLNSAGDPIWTKHFGNPDSDELLHDLVLVADSGFVAALTTKSPGGNWDAILARFSKNGDLVWQKRIETPGDDQIRRLQPLPDGTFAGCGWLKNAPDGKEQPLLLRFGGSGNLIWARTWEAAPAAFLTDFGRDPEGWFMACGYIEDPATKRKSGLVIQFSQFGIVEESQIFRSRIGEEAYFSIEIPDNYTGAFFSIGGFTDYVSSITIGDTVQIPQLWLLDQSILFDPDTILSAPSTFLPPNLENVSVTAISQKTGDALDVLLSNDAPLQSPRGLYMDWEILPGNQNPENWHRYAGNGTGSLNRALFSGTSSFYIGKTAAAAGPGDFWLLKPSKTGRAGTCPMETSNSQLSALIPSVSPLPLQGRTPPVFADANMTALNYALDNQEVCPDACADVPCKMAWTKTFGRANVREGLNSAVEAPDGTFWCVGFKGDSTLLLRFAPDGTMLWGRTFRVSGLSDRPTDLKMDSEGKLIVVGYGASAVNQTSAYAFKFDPLSETLVWAKATPNNQRTNFFGIEEAGAGGPYRVAGTRLYGNLSDPNQEIEWLELDRNTGNILSETALRTADFCTVQQLKKHGNALYISGLKKTFDPADQRGFLSKFDLTGQETWTRDFSITNSLVQNSLDLAFSGDSVFVIVPQATLTQVLKFDANGNNDPGSSFTIFRSVFERMVLDGEAFYFLNPQGCLKTNRRGQIQWSKKFDTALQPLLGRVPLLVQNELLFAFGQVAGFGSPGDMFMLRLPKESGDFGNPECGTGLLDAEAGIFIGTSLENIDLQEVADVLTLTDKAVLPRSAELFFGKFGCGSPCFELCDNGLNDDYDYNVDCFDDNCFCPDCDNRMADTWVFGARARLDFDLEPLRTAQIPGDFDALGASAVQCDPGGRLLIYTDGQTIFDRNHQPMPGGQGIWGAADANDCLILPIENWYDFEENRGFIVYTPTGDTASNFPNSILRTVVDMSENGGLGAVSPNQKNIELPALAYPMTTKLAAFRNCDGRAELIGQCKNGKGYQIWDVPLNLASPDAAIFLKSHHPSVGILPENDNGQMKFSPDKRFFANALPGSGAIEFFDFSVGFIVSGAQADKNKPFLVSFPGLEGVSGLEFSPDGRFLYCATRSNLGNRLWQLDLRAGDALAIADSRVLLGESPVLGYFGDLQIGTDGKIYVAMPSIGSALGVIHQPDKQGLACQWQAAGQPLASGAACRSQLPSFPTLQGRPQGFFEIIAPDSLCQVPDILTLTTRRTLCGPLWIVWTNAATGDTLHVFEFSPFVVVPDSVGFVVGQPGVFSVAADLIGDCFTLRDTASIVILENTAPPLELGEDIVACENAVFQLNAGAGYQRYRWNDGSAEATLTTAFPGKYWVEVWDICGGKQTDTLTISVKAAPKLDLGADYSGCRGAASVFERPADFVSWQWSPGQYLSCDTCATVGLKPEKSSTYVVLAQNAEGCLSTDTLSIGVDTLFQTLDTMLCFGQNLVFPGGLVAAPDTSLRLYFVDNAGCDVALDATLSAFPMLQVSLPPDTTLKIGDTLQLAVNVNGTGTNFNYAWSPPGASLSCFDCPEPQFFAVENSVLSVQVSDANDCFDLDSMQIRVLDSCSVRAPNVFTPNGDGLNDSFTLVADPCVTVLLSFRIFNRWGELVFSETNIAPENLSWDGRTEQGQALPMDVLIWVCEMQFYNGKTRLESGELTLIR